uniref:Sulfotransfer_1 domain-containing protein n=1 Tax=Strongyloides papillosus TaxID=174720 RepID=A0A0N5C570_STREA
MYYPSNVVSKLNVYKPLIILLSILAWICLLNIFNLENKKFVNDLYLTSNKEAVDSKENEVAVNKNEILSILYNKAEYDEIISPFVPITIRDRIRVSQKYKLLSCSLHKHLSSMISPAMCYLKDEHEYVKKYGDVIAENQNACINSGDFHHNVLEVLKYNELDDWIFFSLSRDPIERFISGFSNICIDILNMEQRALCYNCGSNMDCFVTTLYKDILNYSRTRRMMNYFIAAHFFPQNWMCDYFQFFRKYVIISYSSNRDKEVELLEGLKRIFDKANIPQESQKFIMTKFNSTKTVHSTINSESHKVAVKMLYESPKLMRILYKIFYYDFILFNYSIPEEYLPKVAPVKKLTEYRLR